jgi:PAS domain S-box-containing protein
METIWIDPIFQDIVETLREPILVLDSNLKVVLANRSFTHSFKVTPEETLGNFIYNLGNNQWDIPKLRELLDKILMENITFNNFEIEHEFPDIGHKVMLLNARHLVEKETDSRMILLAIEDITERRRLETLLSDSEERYRRLFETANDGILLLEKREGKITHANPAITTMLGYSNKEFTGNDLKDVGFSNDLGTIQEILRTLNKDGIIHYKDSPVQNKTGQVVDTDIYMVDKASLIQCNIRNITERKQADKEKKAVESQLHQSQKIESVGTLAGGVAHEINNVLSIIMGNNEIALDTLPEWSPIRTYLEDIRVATHRARDVVRQLLTFSRQDNAEKKPLDIGSVVKESIKLIRSSIPANIEIKLTIADDVARIFGNATQMSQVLINLCGNAVYAMLNRGDTIAIDIKNGVLDEKYASVHLPSKSGRYVRLMVSDNGCGMNKETLDKIFEPYFTTKGVGKGTGIGLAVVHGIVEKHDGLISVESEPDKGTVFTLLFPACGEAVDLKLKEHISLPAGKEQILFVDDEPGISKLGKQSLEKLGYTVHSATDPVEALNMFKADPGSFDLVITDMAMPHMTGVQLASEIRRIRSKMPIMLCTGCNENISDEKVCEIGICSVALKPLDRTAFAVSVRKALDEAKTMFQIE